MFKNFIVAIAVLGIVLNFILIQDVPLSGDKIKLGDLKYKFDVIDAPATHSTLLKIVSYFASKSPIGPTIRRLMINKNGIIYLRELAAQIKLPPLYYPMRRLSTEERNNVEVENNKLGQYLQHGLDVINNDLVEHKTHITNSHLRSIEDYSRYYKHGHLPSHLINNALHTISQWEREGFYIFASLLPDDVMRQAFESDDRYKAGKSLSVFDGVPVAIKDTIDVKGHKIYNGRNPHAEGVIYEVATKDDIIVERLRALGAIILGTTIMTEGGMSPLGFNVHHQGPVNPFSNSRYSGGSSSGSAVAVATGLVPVAIGFDSGGSVRIPASLCGIHGLAATFGRIPFSAEVAEDTMMRAGPMGATAGDVALTYAAISASEKGHFYSKLYDGGVQGPPTLHVEGFNNVEDLSDMRIGIFPEWFNDSDPLVSNQVYKAVTFLKSRGATLVEIRIPHMQELSLAHGIKISSEFACSHWDKIYSDVSGYKSLEENSKILLSIGATSSAMEALSADKIRHYIYNYMIDLFEREHLDCIVTPTVSVTTPSLLKHIKTYGESNTALVMQFMKYVFLANLIGMSGYSVPVGFVLSPKNNEEKSQAGGNGVIELPVGLHLLGNHWEEHKLLRIAHSIESGFPVQNVSEKLTHYYDPFAI